MGYWVLPFLLRVVEWDLKMLLGSSSSFGLENSMSYDNPIIISTWMNLGSIFRLKITLHKQADVEDHAILQNSGG